MNATGECYPLFSDDTKCVRSIFHGVDVDSSIDNIYGSILLSMILVIIVLLYFMIDIRLLVIQ